MKRVRIIISGEVIGVGFRFFIKEYARDLGITGIVKNMDDNKVEAIFEGEEKNIEELISKCKAGPDSAKVSDIVIKEEKFRNEFRDFEIIN